jgi:hypothetical protein
LTSLLGFINPVLSQQRACVITDEGTTVCGKLTTSAKKPNRSLEKRQEFDKFVFSLKGCRRQDENIKCDFAIANRGSEDRLLYVYADSSLVDSNGRSYFGSSLEIGEKSSKGEIPLTVSPGINYNAILTFENVPERITQVPLLNIKTYQKLIQFRNVDFTK